MGLNSFTKIGQFRNVIRSVCERSDYQGADENGDPIYKRSPRPKIVFNGSCKVHGTNASCGFKSDGKEFYQSRKNVLGIGNDNQGFVFFCTPKEHIFREWHKIIKERVGIKDSSVIMFGEFCGGNIQKGVAINGLSKRFIMFAVKITPDDEEQPSYYLNKGIWKDLSSPDDLLFNINDFKTFEVEIDFENPQLIQNKIVKLVEEVEEECPVGKAFGRVKGEDCTIGEGIVWVGWYKGNRYVFKTKGEKHSVSKVKTIAAVDIEKLESINEFVDYSVTENRMNQAIEQVFTVTSIQPDIKKTGDFLRWLVNDITKEEIDVLTENGLEPKDVNRDISMKARVWYFKYLDEIEF